MRRQKRRCKNCRSFFEVCTKVKKHEYCKKEACQKVRKKNGRSVKLPMIKLTAKIRRRLKRFG